MTRCEIKEHPRFKRMREEQRERSDWCALIKFYCRYKFDGWGLWDRCSARKPFLLWPRGCSWRRCPRVASGEKVRNDP